MAVIEETVMVLRCDDCGAAFPVLDLSATTFRAAAAADGWSTSGPFDLCRGCQ